MLGCCVGCPFVFLLLLQVPWSGDHKLLFGSADKKEAIHQLSDCSFAPACSHQKRRKRRGCKLAPRLFAPPRSDVVLARGIPVKATCQFPAAHSRVARYVAAAALRAETISCLPLEAGFCLQDAATTKDSAVAAVQVGPATEAQFWQWGEELPAPVGCEDGLGKTRFFLS